MHDKLVPSNTMTAWMHECIACDPAGNLEGSMKFYCLMMGRILKWRPFTPMPMPNHIIKQLNQIGLREKQGQNFWFLNRSKEPYKWTDTVPEGDPEFQGSLEEEAPFPDVGAKLPGVTLEEEEEGDYQVVTNETKPALETLATAALENTGIDAAKQIWAAQAAADAAARAGVIAAQSNGPCLREANKDKIVCKITFDIPDKGIILAYDNMVELPDAGTADIPSETSHYPTQSCRSVMLGNQPYNAYAPHIQFLHLGEVQLHRSALTAINEQKLHSGEMVREQIHTTTATIEINNAEHVVDKELMTTHKHKIAVWGYLIT